MAAPLELRTPAGTCGRGCKQSADGSMATMARETTGRRTIQGEYAREMERGGSDGAPEARMRRCRILRQGASPLRPRPPFPLALCCRTEAICQGFASRAKAARPGARGRGGSNGRQRDGNWPAAQGILFPLSRFPRRGKAGAGGFPPRRDTGRASQLRWHAPCGGSPRKRDFKSLR